MTSVRVFTPQRFFRLSVQGVVINVSASQFDVNPFGCLANHIHHLIMSVCVRTVCVLDVYQSSGSDAVLCGGLYAVSEAMCNEDEMCSSGR